jgi:hypothetical protein
MKLPIANEDSFAELRTLILRFDSASLEVVMDAYDSDKSFDDFVLSDSVPCLIQVYTSSAPKRQQEIISCARILLGHVSEPDRVVSLILKQASATDARLRQLAVSLMPAVASPQRLRNALLSLMLDRVPAVRCAVVSNLAAINVDDKMIVSMLKSAVNDKAPQVQIAAVKLLASSAPSLLTEYLSLLQRPAVAAAALLCLPAIVAAHGLTVVFDAVISAIEIAPNEATDGILDTLPYVQEHEKDMLVLLATQLCYVPLFLQNFAEFAKAMAEPARLLEIIELKNIPKWRDRFFLLKQVTDCVQEMGLSLIDWAVAFANDEVAIVRVEAVKLWVELIGFDPEARKELTKLTAGKWHARLVAAKVICEVGIEEDCEDVAQTLSADAVENVRACLRHGVKGTVWFAKFFAEAEDGQVVQM